MAATPLVTLEQLPDDMIARVLQYVAVRDVLSCRLVSKRLCSVALHWDVWRHRTVRDDDPFAGAVLRLAPCLETMRVTGRVQTLAATTTACAVAKLILSTDPSLDFNAAEYALAVRNQESLGRLRELVLYLHHSEETEADVLYRTVASCSGLESLTVFFFPPQINHPIVRGALSSSLTYFNCEAVENSASFVNTILAGHAATLEEVEIPDSDLRESTTAKLLAGMPRLRRLQCDSGLRGLEAVAECKALREVHLNVYMSRGDSNTAAQFLYRANQLRRVHLQSSVINVTEGQSTGLADALEALASSGRRSRVERLTLLVGGMPPLLRSLPSLPALRCLGLDLDLDDELLRGITPVTAPALRLLEFVVRTGKCPHSWMHGDAVKATLTANPLLHIQLWSDTGSESDPKDCETCAAACHQGVSWHGVRKIGLYSHDPGTCPSPEAHTDVSDRAWSYRTRFTANLACTWIHV